MCVFDRFGNSFVRFSIASYDLSNKEIIYFDKVRYCTGFRWSNFTADSAVLFGRFAADTGSNTSRSFVNRLLHSGEYYGFFD